MTPFVPIRLFVVDDHALFREGLLRLLDGDPQLHVIGSAPSMDAALEQLRDEAPDVLIADYDLGKDTALGLIQRLQEQGFTGRTLLVTAGLPNEDAVELIRMGVGGIFHKHDPLDELRRSILEVASGRVLIGQNYLQKLVESTSNSKPVSGKLTERDRQILSFLLEGNSNKEIASHLHASESAVKASLQQLFAKTGVRTRSQLVRIALERYRDHLL